METGGLEQRWRNRSTRPREFTASQRASKRAEQQRESRKRRTKAQHVAIAVRILAFTAPSVNAVEAYHRQHGDMSEGTNCFVEQVVDAYLSTPDEAVLDFTKPAAASDGAHSRWAQHFLEQYRVHEWIAEQNTRNGIAPGPRDVLRQRQVLWVARRAPCSSRPSFGTSKGAAHRWVKKLRARWRLRTLTSAEHEVEKVETTQAKVWHGGRP